MGIIFGFLKGIIIPSLVGLYGLFIGPILRDVRKNRRYADNKPDFQHGSAAYFLARRLHAAFYRPLPESVIDSELLSYLQERKLQTTSEIYSSKATIISVNIVPETRKIIDCIGKVCLYSMVAPFVLIGACFVLLALADLVVPGAGSGGVAPGGLWWTMTGLFVLFLLVSVVTIMLGIFWSVTGSKHNGICNIMADDGSILFHKQPIKFVPENLIINEELQTLRWQWSLSKRIPIFIYRTTETTDRVEFGELSLFWAMIMRKSPQWKELPRIRDELADTIQRASQGMPPRVVVAERAA